MLSFFRSVLGESLQLLDAIKRELALPVFTTDTAAYLIDRAAC